MNGVTRLSQDVTCELAALRTEVYSIRANLGTLATGFVANGNNDPRLADKLEAVAIRLGNVLNANLTVECNTPPASEREAILNWAQHYDNVLWSAVPRARPFMIWYAAMQRVKLEHYGDVVTTLTWYMNLAEQMVKDLVDPTDRQRIY